MLLLSLVSHSMTRILARMIKKTKHKNLMIDQTKALEILKKYKNFFELDCDNSYLYNVPQDKIGDLLIELGILENSVDLKCFLEAYLNKSINGATRDDYWKGLNFQEVYREEYKEEDRFLGWIYNTKSELNGLAVFKSYFISPFEPDVYFGFDCPIELKYFVLKILDDDRLKDFEKEILSKAIKKEEIEDILVCENNKENKKEKEHLNSVDFKNIEDCKDIFEFVSKHSLSDIDKIKDTLFFFITGKDKPKKLSPIVWKNNENKYLAKLVYEKILNEKDRDDKKIEKWKITTKYFCHENGDFFTEAQLRDGLQQYKRNK
jgi:hypothetical protein